MTWLKLDDRFARHPKVVGLKHFAFRVHVTALLGCAAHETDGVVKWAWLRPEAARGKPASVLRAACELVECGLWERIGGDETAPVWLIHDYLKYQPSRSQLQAKRAKIAERVAKHRERNGVTRQDETALLENTGNGVTKDRVTLPPARPGPFVPTRELDPRPDTSEPPDAEDALSPSPNTGRDPMAYMRGGGPTQRADVLRLFAAWQRTFGYRSAKFRGYCDLDAQRLADALDTYGEAACVKVLHEAPNDGMVSGKDDDRGKKHDSIRYLFENAETFNRILRAAEDREKRHGGGIGESVSSIIAAARGET